MDESPFKTPVLQMESCYHMQMTTLSRTSTAMNKNEKEASTQSYLFFIDNQSASLLAPAIKQFSSPSRRSLSLPLLLLVLEMGRDDKLTMGLLLWTDSSEMGNLDML